MVQLIDSGVFIGLERRGLAVSDLAAIGADQPAAFASITASELLRGVLRASPSRRRTARAAFVESIFATIKPVAFDLLAARVHARVWSHLAAAGTPIGANDLLIAATALAHGYAVLTDNAGEFGRVPGLVVR